MLSVGVVSILASFIATASGTSHHCLGELQVLRLKGCCRVRVRPWRQEDVVCSLLVIRIVFGLVKEML